MEAIGLKKCLMFNCSNTTTNLASASKRFSRIQARCHELRFEEGQQQGRNLELNLDVFKETQIITVEAVSKPKTKPKPKVKSKSKSNSYSNLIQDVLLGASFVNWVVLFAIAVNKGELKHSFLFQRRRCSSCCCCHQYHHHELETPTVGNEADVGPYTKATCISWLLFLGLLVSKLSKVQ